MIGIFPTEIFREILKVAPLSAVNSLARACSQLASMVNSSVADRFVERYTDKISNVRRFCGFRLPNGTLHGPSRIVECDLLESLVVLGAMYDRGKVIEWKMIDSVNGEPIATHGWPNDNITVAQYTGMPFENRFIIQMDFDERIFEAELSSINPLAKMWSREQIAGDEKSCIPSVHIGTFPRPTGIEIDGVINHDLVRAWMCKHIAHLTVGLTPRSGTIMESWESDIRKYMPGFI